MILQILIFVFQEICFKVNYKETFQISSDFHIKNCWSLTRRAILKTPGTSYSDEPKNFLFSKFLLEDKTPAGKKYKVSVGLSYHQSPNRLSGQKQ